MIKLSTEVALQASKIKLSYRQKSMMMGSCFAESVGTKLDELCFPIEINPFGILYNPDSIANSLEILLSEKLFSATDLFYANNMWNSFYHHSRFSNANKEECLANINKRITKASKTLRESNLLFITFGTSMVYEYISSGQIVSNCHKLPSTNFRHYRLSPDGIVNRWIELIHIIHNVNADLNIVFTVSPLRHLKDGEHENQLNKSVLLIAVDEIIRRFADKRIFYFPSYEIVLDELRDYRFYSSDMIHLNEIAVNFIREKFSSVFITEEDMSIASEIEKLRKALDHKPLNRDSDEYRIFIEKQIEKVAQLKDKFSFLDLELFLHEFYLKKLP